MLTNQLKMREGEGDDCKDGMELVRLLGRSVSIAVESAERKNKIIWLQIVWRNEYWNK